MESSLLAPFKHCWIVFVAETKRLVTYRAQFWFELISSSIIEIIVAIALWRAVFASSVTSTIRDYSIENMILYVTVAIFFGQAAKGTGVGTFQREVYEGSLTKYLIFPLSVYSYKFGTFSPRSLFAVGQLAIALLVISLAGYWPVTTHLSFIWIFLGLLSLFFACLLYFFLLIALESLSFWVDNVWTLSYALQIAIVFLSGKAIPLSFFPKWLESAAQLLPFPYIVYFPVRTFLGEVKPTEFLLNFSILITWVAIAFATSRIVMKKGLHHYSGVGQ